MSSSGGGGGDDNEEPSGLLSFIFGNVNEEGKLDNEDMDEELRASLLNSGNVLSKFLKTSILGASTEDLASASGDSGESSGALAASSALTAGKIRPAEDAVDYADMNEAIDEEIPPMPPVPFAEVPEGVVKPVPIIPQPLPQQQNLQQEPPQQQQQQQQQQQRVDSPKQQQQQPETRPFVNLYTKKLLETLSEDTLVKFTQLSFAPGQYEKPMARTRANVRKDAHIGSMLNKLKPVGQGADEQALFNSEIILEDVLPPSRDRDDEFSYRNQLKVARDEQKKQMEQLEKSVAAGNSSSLFESTREEESVAAAEVELIEEIYTEGAAKAAADFNDRQFHPVVVTDWESKIVWDDDEDDDNCSESVMEIDDIVQGGGQRASGSSMDFSIPDYDLLIGDWTDRIVWGDEEDEAVGAKIPAIEIPMNDPHLIIDILYPMEDSEEFLEAKKAAAKSAPKRQQLLAAGGINDLNQNIPHPFNLSNDRYYEVYRLHNTRQGKMQRANLSKTYIEHSLPALQLKMPFFRRYMSKADMRSFHRPPLKLAAGEIMKFQRIKQLKNRKKMYKGQAMSDILQDVEDITLKDNTSYVMFEYSEEYPPLLSNSGMGSLIVNYYRKKDEKDPFIPKMPLGVPHVLEQVDASPFFMFGQVHPGDSMQAIKNNLYIAPIFMHESKHDDFLLIRVTPKLKKKKKQQQQQQLQANGLPAPVHYVREIPKIFTVGQTFPVTLVHPPQSRKMKLFIRDRLKVLALRRIKKRGRNAKYPVHHIVNSFHRYHDQSIRKHLRDFADVIRGPNNSQYLKVHASVPIPSEQELYKMCTPEMVCCFESLRVGQQRLADIGYGSQSLNVGDNDDEDDNETEQPGEDDMQMDDEIQLAPWNVTRNFLLAAQQKGMIQVYGPGDPTGRGEGFSMFRFSMKEMFIRAGASRDEIDAYYESQTKTGHKFSITDQQKMYQEELRRVWEKQKTILASKADLELDQDDIMRSAMGNANAGDRVSTDNEMMDADEEREWREVMRIYGEDRHKAASSSHPRAEPNSNHPSNAPSPQFHPSGIPNIAEFDNQSLQSFSSRNINATLKKALLVRRLVNGQWQEEVVTDPRVIQPYMKQKRLMEIAGAGKNAISVEDDEETIKKKIKGELRRLKRESGISKADLLKRAQAARNEEDGDRLGGSQRKCRSCGQLGHIMTNRICPNYATNYPERAKMDAASNIKIENGKLVIPTLALQVVEEKIKKEKSKAERQRELYYGINISTPKATDNVATPAPAAAVQPPPSQSVASTPGASIDFSSTDLLALTAGLNPSNVLLATAAESNEQSGQEANGSSQPTMILEPDGAEMIHPDYEIDGRANGIVSGVKRPREDDSSMGDADLLSYSQPDPRINAAEASHQGEQGGSDPQQQNVIMTLSQPATRVPEQNDERMTSSQPEAHMKTEEDQ